MQLQLLNCKVCQDLETDQIELSWVKRITICVCPICKGMHKPVLIPFPGSTKASYYRLEGRRDGCQNTYHSIVGVQYEDEHQLKRLKAESKGPDADKPSSEDEEGSDFKSTPTK